LAIAADMRPEYAILLGSVLAPVIKAIDPTEKQYGLGSKE
jgi:hypothetical protein